MTPVKPLANAAQRLRGVPGFPRPVGRPRMRPIEPETTSSSASALAKAASAALPVVHSDPTSRDVMGGAECAVPVNVPVIAPRVLGVRDAAAYAGVSTWVVRAWIEAGHLRRVRYPAAGGQELRRLLIARDDLDALIDAARRPA